MGASRKAEVWALALSSAWAVAALAGEPGAVAGGASLSAADAAAALTASATAATADPAHGHILYLKHCARCHGTHAWGDGPRAIPTLAGQWERYLREQLARFATGARQGSVAHGTAMHETLQPPDVNRPQALADLAAWLASAPRLAEPEHAAGTVHGGAAAYARACAPCHGADGRGSEREPVPAIGGQHYSYLLGQLDAMAAATRPHPQGPGGAALAERERAPVADHAAHLTWLTARGVPPPAP